MEKTINVTFDGEVFRPDETVDIPTDTKGRITVENGTGKLEMKYAKRKPGGKPYAAFEYMRSVKLDGPSDFSANVDEYIYHGKPFPDEK